MELADRRVLVLVERWVAQRVGDLVDVIAAMDVEAVGHWDALMDQELVAN